jgi:anti-sigma factor RsiW
MSRHATPETLALYAAGDLGRIAAWRLRVHLAVCPRCAAEAARFRDLRRGLTAAAGTLPPELDWARLAADMKANIRLGLEMGRIAETVPRRRLDPTGESVSWRAYAVAASLAIVTLSGWYLQRGGDPYRLAPPPVLASSAEGLAFQERGAALTLLAPAGFQNAATVETADGLRARYVDSETGQVTIHHVYPE